MCLARSGQADEAQAILAPLEVKSDALLEKFLSSARGSIDKATLFVSSPRTILARRIVATSPSGESVYFEHLKLRNKGCERISSFYACLPQALGNAVPAFVPRLHREFACGPYWYFLYEHIPIASDLEFAFGREGSAFDLELGKRTVGCLVQISTEFQKAFGRDQIGRTLARDVACDDIERHLRGEIGRRSHDSEFSRSLADALKRWPDHHLRLGKLMQVPCHGDAHGANFVLSNDGRLSVLDWECCGWAPIALDLVLLFVDRLEYPEFELLLDLYFDGVAADMKADERRYIVALLSVLTTIDRARPLPGKWLHYLNG
jgi:hypothetical protein